MPKVVAAREKRMRTVQVPAVIRRSVGICINAAFKMPFRAKSIKFTCTVAHAFENPT